MVERLRLRPEKDIQKKQEDKMTDCKELLSNIEKIHTTEMGEERIRRNLSLGKEILDTVGWCKEQIGLPEARIVRRGKNWYATIGGNTFTVNAYNYTIITAHRERANT